MKKITFKILGSLIAIIIFTGAPISFATSSSSISSQISDTKSKLQEVQTQKEESQNKVEELTNQSKTYQEQIDELTKEIKAKQEEVKTAQDKMDKLTKEIEEKQKLLDDRLTTYVESGNSGFLDVLLSSTDFTEMISNYFLVESVTSADQETMNEIEKDKKEVEEIQNKLNSDLQEIQDKKAKQQELQKKVNAQKSAEQSKVDELEKSESELKAKMSALDKQNKENEEKLKSKLSSLSASSSGFIRPIADFSIGTTWYYSDGRLHGGVDFPTGGKIGYPVYAVADGVVITATWGGGDSYGNYVLIKHGNGLYTLYAHGSSLKVSTGQVVKQGQVIMLSGNTGNSTGPHLHFEVRTGGGGYSERVNPLNYIR